MQRIPLAIPSVQLTTAATDIFTASGGATGTINNLSLTNTSEDVVTVSLFRVAAGATAGNANAFLYQFSLAAHQTYVPAGAIGLHINAGGKIQGLASTAAVVTVNGGVYATSGS